MKKLVFVVAISLTACSQSNTETNVDTTVNNSVEIDSMDLMDSVGIEQIKRLDSIYKEH